MSAGEKVMIAIIAACIVLCVFIIEALRGLS
jgi:hypothetical protein